MTARRRASQVGDALRRGFAPVQPARRSDDEKSHHDGGADQSVGQPGQVVSGPVTRRPPKGSKYTALLDDETAAAFDELALKARRVLGRRVEKAELMRVLIMLAADDASLRDQVIAEVEARKP